MVQANGPDNYWRVFSGRRLTDELKAQLIDYGYTDTGAVSDGLSSKRVHRMDRNILCYEACTDEELEQFIKHRKTKVNLRGRKTRPRIIHIKALEAADEKWTFGYMNELSAELRCEIYKHYFADFPEHLQKPVQPPLTRVSRLIRNDSIPLFFQNCSFDIKLQRKGLDGREYLGIHDDSYTWLQSLTPENASDIKRFRITVMTQPEMYNKAHLAFTVDIDIRKKSTSLKSPGNFMVVGDDGESGRFRWSRRPEDAEIKLGAFFEFVREIFERPGEKKLKTQDFWDMRRAIESALYKRN